MFNIMITANIRTYQGILIISWNLEKYEKMYLKDCINNPRKSLK